MKIHAILPPHPTRRSGVGRCRSGPPGTHPRSFLAVFLLLGIWLAALTIPGSASAQNQGHVIFATRHDVYLDAGALDGLEPGQTLTLTRLGDPVATLEVSYTSDHRASARVVSLEAPILKGDMFSLPVQEVPRRDTQTARVEPAEPTKKKVPVPDSDWASLWVAVLTHPPRNLVRYAPDQHRTPAFWFDGRAHTEVTARAALDPTWLNRQEQTLFLRARAANLGYTGIDLSVRGKLAVRYDQNPDRYLEGRQAIPLFREVAVRYAPDERGLTATLGRFRPIARNTGIVDGAQVSWRSGKASIGAFGGLRPAPDSLLPRTDASAFGVGATWRTAGEKATWRHSTGVTSTYYKSSPGRQSAYLDNLFTKEDTWSIHQSLTMDYAPPGAVASGQTGVVLADAALFIDYGKTQTRRLLLSARHTSLPLYLEDMDTLPGTWVNALADRTLSRIDLGVRQRLRSNRSALQPYVYYFQEAGTAYNDWVVAGGIRYRQDQVAATRLVIEASADYGDGTRQQARADVSASSRIAQELHLAWGVLEQWTYTHDSGLHTFQHIGYLRVSSLVADSFQLWVLGLGELDHDLSEQPPSGWLEASGGLAFTW